MLSIWGFISPETCPWAHTDRIIGTAHKTVGFVKKKRHINTKMSVVREAVYTTLVLPQLEYGAATRDAHHKDKTIQIEKIQRPVARWITCRNITEWQVFPDMIEALGWRTLEKRCADERLCLVNNMVVVPFLVTSSKPSYIQPLPVCHSGTFCQLHTAKNYYKYSFFTLAIVQRNALPQYVVRSPSLDIIRQQLAGCNIQSPRSQV